MKALVVDDDSLNRELLGRLLRRLGWEADATESGEEALRRHGGSPYDLVFIDLVMPGMNGRQVAEALSGAARWHGGPGRARPFLIAVTGLDAPPWGQSPFDGSLQKPFTLEELSACIDSVLRAG